MLLSVIIPARNERYLQKTIENVLENSGEDTEIIAVLDGYWPDPPINDHPRVKLIHHTEPIGQRRAINEAAKIAQGEFIMKLDAHCAVDKDFDIKLAADCEKDWTVVPRMYNLDVNTFTPKLHKRTDYMYIGWNDKGELRSLYYSGDEWKRQHRKTEEIDDTMTCMGPGWFMRRDRFWELGGCDESQGGKAGWGQQGIEVAMKAWLSGGALKVNKKTWFAHWFRGEIGFPYEISGREIAETRKYSEELWLNNKWPKACVSFEEILNKFSPPGWENYKPMKTIADKEKIDDLNRFFYKYIHTDGRYMLWRGVPVLKMPTDLIIYEQVIWEKKPDIIIDIGTKFGGSALFYQDMLDMVGAGGKVITIDKYPMKKNKDSRITYLEKGSTDAEVLGKVKELVKGKTVMVVIDGDHRRPQVKRELVAYSQIATSGQYVVVEDCYSKVATLSGPGEAKDWFLSRSDKLKQTDLDKQFLIGFCRDGWLLKK